MNRPEPHGLARALELVIKLEVAFREQHSREPTPAEWRRFGRTYRRVGELCKERGRATQLIEAEVDDVRAALIEVATARLEYLDREEESAPAPTSERSDTDMNGKNLLKTSDLAKLCEVDLKTIHNWVEKCSIPHFRTPGRHLRFKPEDVVAFLGKHGYPIPADLRPASSGAAA